MPLNFCRSLIPATLLVAVLCTVWAARPAVAVAAAQQPELRSLGPGG